MREKRCYSFRLPYISVRKNIVNETKAPGSVLMIVLPPMLNVGTGSPKMSMTLKNSNDYINNIVLFK